MSKNKEIVHANATGVDKEARKAIEAERGIARNEAGEIIFTKAQAKARIAMLETKIGDFANRTKNAKARIKELQAFL